MRNQQKCGTEGRREAVKNSFLNGIDYVETIPPKSAGTAPLIVLRFLKRMFSLDESNILIEGDKSRRKNIPIEWARRADNYPSDLVVDEEKSLLNKIIKPAEAAYYLIVRPSVPGDFSTYTLRLIRGSNNRELPPKCFDVVLSSVDFLFKVECATGFDCKLEEKELCPPQVSAEPSIDYMAKDFTSFRLLIRNRLAQIMPEWTEDNPADNGVMLMELLAYIGDNLSYYQDAVATEAYLGTAQSRISARRHARLLDYFIDEGCNSRVCIFLGVDSYLDGKSIPKGTQLLTKSINDKKIILTEEEAIKVIQEEGAKVFETMHNLQVFSAHNEIQFYTWSNSNCCLPAGATHATLRDDDDNNRLRLQVGDLLLFEEISSPTAGKHERDVSHKHMVRLTRIERKVDELTATPIVEIDWKKEDALPFPLCLWELNESNNNTSCNIQENSSKKLVSVARGNIVLADHGLTIRRELLKSDLRRTKRFIPRLSQRHLTFKGPFNENDPVSSAFKYYSWDAQPEIFIEEMRTTANSSGFMKADGTGAWDNNQEEGPRWNAVKDLLSSDMFSREFVVEIENDRTAQIRFGDNNQGMNPRGMIANQSISLYATYRVGNGVDGNVGADAITRMVRSKDFDPTGTSQIYNPMPARGGREPETVDEVRQKSPYAFKQQERAVTESDYIDILEKHPDIQKAAANIRWNGSWYTVHVTIDRYGGKKLDDKFKSKIGTFLDRFRLVGYDIQIHEPRYVSPIIEITVYIDKDHLKSEAKRQLLELFSNRQILPTGKLGFFHSDNLTFGQAVLLSKIYAVVMEVDGVVSANVTKFGRVDRPNEDYIKKGFIQIDQSEIALLDNDPSHPENGRIRFTVVGGR